MGGTRIISARLTQSTSSSPPLPRVAPNEMEMPRPRLQRGQTMQLGNLNAARGFWGLGRTRGEAV